MLDKKLNLTFILFLFIGFSLTIKAGYGQEKGNGEFTSIKEIIKSDKLEEELAKKLEKVKKEKEKEQEKLVKKYEFPSEEDFIKIINELWLSKNATKLKWDFSKIDYGINDTLKKLLLKFGFINIQFKILLLDTPTLAHFALPKVNDEYILLLSLPFIRTMDLTKIEISLLLFQDMIRADAGDLKSYIISEDLKKVFNKNFYKNDLFKKDYVTAVLKKMDEFIFTKGFNFQQQFKTTTKISDLLKSDLEYWQRYLRLLEKMDELVKENKLYQHYLKLYPSPEMQMNWIKPKKDRL